MFKCLAADSFEAEALQDYDDSFFANRETLVIARPIETDDLAIGDRIENIDPGTQYRFLKEPNG